MAMHPAVRQTIADRLTQLQRQVAEAEANARSAAMRARGAHDDWQRLLEAKRELQAALAAEDGPVNEQQQPTPTEQYETAKDVAPTSAAADPAGDLAQAARQDDVYPEDPAAPIGHEYSADQVNWLYVPQGGVIPDGMTYARPRFRNGRVGASTALPEADPS